MITKVVLSVAVWFLSATFAHANISFFEPTEAPAATFLGSEVGPTVVTTRCTPREQQRVPTGIVIHARNDFFLGPLVSGIELTCEGKNDAMAMTSRILRPLAGRADDGSVPGAPYPRVCPTGQVLVGINGRAGLMVDAVTIVCSEANPALTTGNAVNEGQTFTIGNPIFGSGGSGVGSVCPGNTFVRSIRVEFDSNFIKRMRVNCQMLLSGGPVFFPEDIDLAATTRNQRVVFNGMSADGFSLSIVNLGRNIDAGQAVVELTINTDFATISAPASCTSQQIGLSIRRFRCNVPALAAGNRALIGGFQITPERVIQTTTQVGTVAVVADDDVDPANNVSSVAILVPSVSGRSRVSVAQSASAAAVSIRHSRVEAAALRGRD